MSTTAALSILESAKEKEDEELLLEIQGQDLMAKEAQYHTSCRKEYTRKLERNVLKSGTVGAEEQRAHTLALEQLCKFSDQRIMTELNVEMISTLRECYLSFLQETHFYNPEYRTRRLREKLLRHYGERLAFHFEQQEKDDFVYSDSLTANDAIGKFHNSSSSEKVKVEQAAMILQRTVKEAFKISDTLRWPPSAEFLTSGRIQPPKLLTRFVSNCLISGNPLGNSQNTQRLRSSFAQNLYIELIRMVNGKCPSIYF